MYIYIYTYIHIANSEWCNELSLLPRQHLYRYMYIYVYVHIYTYTHAHTPVCVHIHIYIYVHIHRPQQMEERALGAAKASEGATGHVQPPSSPLCRISVCAAASCFRPACPALRRCGGGRGWGGDAHFCDRSGWPRGRVARA